METFENIIQSYIENRAKEDSLFAETCKKANKSIKGCCKYIYSQAKNMAKGGKVVGIDDDTVFGWAVHYYDEDSIEIDEVDDELVEVSAPSEDTLKSTIHQERRPKRVKKEKINNMQLSLFSEL
nr:MAG TPA: PcfK-like protein [Caudoviricetes sp.]